VTVYKVQLVRLGDCIVRIKTNDESESITNQFKHFNLHFVEQKFKKMS